MRNQLLEEVEYKVKKTDFGTWRSFGYANGKSFHEFKSHSRLLGLPLVHYTFGKNPETGRRKCAKGFIAVGCFARGIISVGLISIGCLATGLLAFGLLAIGGLGMAALFAFAQFAFAPVAVGQFAIGLLFGLGQFATGYVAIGQIAFGKYVFAQVGFGQFVKSMSRADQQALEFFRLWPVIKNFLK